MKKLALFLILAIIFTALCACAPKEENFTNEFDLSISEDWSGQEFSIVQTSTIDETPLYYKRDTLLADNALERMQSVADKHNCDVKLAYFGVDATFKTLMAAAMTTGSALGDIVFAAPYQTREIGNAGGLIDFENITDIIDIYDEAKWGAPNTWEFMMCKGIMCGVVPVSWLQFEPYVFYPIVFNSDLTRIAGLGDLRELYETGTWTREKMLETIVACTDNTLGTPQKGMAACLKHFIRAALLNNGTEFAVFNEDASEFYCGWSTDEGIEALIWVKSVLDEYLDYMYEFDNTAYGDWNYTNPFVNNEAALLLTSSSKIFDTVAYEVDNFGLMPFPAGPYGDPDEWVGFYETAQCLSIPYYAKEVECSAILIDEIFSPLEQYPDTDALKDYYTSNVFSDDRDYNVLLEMGKNCKYSFWPDDGDALLNALYGSLSRTTPAAIFESSGHVSDACIQNQMIPSILTIRRLTGDDTYD